MGVGFIDEKQEQKEAILPINYTHMLILGETGSGKTTGIINPNIKHRMEEGHGVLVFDYKGHYHTHIKALAKQCGRLEDVIMIGEPWGENINILSLLNENGIEEILNVLLVFNDGKNTFWERSAINLAIEILTIIKNFRMSGIYKYEYNLKTLFEISTNAQTLKDFKKEIIPTMKENYNEFDKDECVYVYNIKKSLDKLDKLAKDSELDSVIKGTRRVIGDVLDVLSKPLSKIARFDFLNTYGIDPAKALDDRKIIVIKTNALGENELSVLVKALFHKLYDRFIDFKTPVSIFIDEAQKVLNKNFELPIDVLREVKVDIVLATQSIANLENKLDKSYTQELLANLTTKVYLIGQDSEVKQGYYKINDESPKPFKPLYIDKKEAFQAEYEYQNLIQLTKKLRFTNLPDKKGIFVYSTFLDKNTLIFEDENQNKQFVEYITTDYINDCNKGKEFLSTLKEEIDREENRKKRLEELKRQHEEICEDSDEEIPF